MQRLGECNGCGWCCQYESIHALTARGPNGGELPLDDQRFYKLRGGEVVDGGKAVRFLVQGYSPCSNHDAENKACKAYEGRPQSCRDFPSVPQQIEGTPCSFYFEIEVDGEKHRRGGKGSPYPTQPVFEG
jgi:Fe-S-cluster containining protein